MVFKCEGRGYDSPFPEPCDCYGCQMNRDRNALLERYEDDFYKCMYIGAGLLALIFSIGITIWWNYGQ